MNDGLNTLVRNQRTTAGRLIIAQEEFHYIFTVQYTIFILKHTNEICHKSIAIVFCHLCKRKNYRYSSHKA
jgi:hypothetical protein